jgi:hypothetical protein
MADYWWRHLIPAKLLLESDPAAVSTVEQAYAPRWACIMHFGDRVCITLLQAPRAVLPW